MNYVSVDVEVHLDDILWKMSSREKQELVDDLYDDGYTPTQIHDQIDKHTDDFSEACKKLIGEAWRLTREEEEFIINISKRF
jgi:hypothetical protein